MLPIWRHTTANVDETLDAAGVPQVLGFLSIDIDSWDLQVWASLSREPAVVVIEYNSMIPADADWVLPPDRLGIPGWGTTAFFGSGFLPLLRLGALKGYVLVHSETRGSNLIFVRADLAGRLRRVSSGRIPWVPKLGREAARRAFQTQVGWTPCFTRDLAEMRRYPWSHLSAQVPFLEIEDVDEEWWEQWSFVLGEGGVEGSWIHMELQSGM
mmetsp:Transcript_35195/g.88903  ORF Transcript_35195/g.88903 Transcript_35195/m.88903 type:complete len:212 (+) Transcript_35195:1155-1790(+)